MHKLNLWQKATIVCVKKWCEESFLGTHWSPKKLKHWLNAACYLRSVCIPL